MKFKFLPILVPTALTLCTACSDEPTSKTPDKQEQYVRDFVTAIGVPAKGHEYSMAKSAGLKVTTKTGTNLTVTAEVDGTEYLFANLYVEPGTHAIPVTIPRSVSTLVLSTSTARLKAAPDAIVNLDEAREDDTPIQLQDNGLFIINDTSNDGNLTMEPDPDKAGYPYLAFDPQKILKPYLDAHLGKESTSKDKERITFNAAGDKYLSYPGEGILSVAASSSGYSYYIFPIWWRRSGGQSDGVKDYETHLFKVRSGRENITGDYIAPFSYGNNGNSGIPFPGLGATDQDLARNDIDLDKLAEQFNFDDGTFDKAYDPDATKMAISRGMRVWMIHNNLTYRPKISMYIKSDNGNSFSSAAPFYNSIKWNGNYFDVTLDDLYNAMVSAQYVQMTANNEVFISSPDIEFKKKWDYNKHEFINDSGTWTESGIFNNRSTGYNYLLGFNAPATKHDDDAMRDYCDVIFLITASPLGNYGRGYQYNKLPDPYKWTIAAEDLGGSFDWDFNDAVFTFTDVVCDLKSVNDNHANAVLSGPISAQAIRKITVTPLAAGGTMPLYITFTGKQIYTMPTLPTSGTEKFSDANNAIIEHFKNNGVSGTVVLGTEIHKWLGQADYTKMLNTGTSRQDMNAQPIVFALPIETVPDDYLQIHAPGTTGENLPLAGFSVYVDKDNALGIDARSGDGFKYVSTLSLGEGNYLLGKPAQGADLTAPQMILIDDQDWEWPQEQKGIHTAYPDFPTWVQTNDNNSKWYETKVEENLTKK